MGLSNPTRKRVEDVIADWPDKTGNTARTMIDKYGEPDEATTERLIWHRNGPWKRTEVLRQGPTHRFPVPHTDHLLQYIDYQVPTEKFDELARFDGSVHAHRTEGELGSTCHKESANFLALNLAHDIVTNQKTVDQAREDYAVIMAKGKAGGSPPYMQGFQFDLPSGSQRDSDVTILTSEIKQRAKSLVGR